MKNKFSIGEMAKLHNTTIKTLHYYDKVGVLKPDYVESESGYRYYTTDQFEQLNTIQYLKELGFSLKEIKSHQDHRDIEGFLELLEKQQELTEIKIEELERVNLRFKNRIEDIKSAQKITELGTPFIKEVEERKVVRLMEKISSEPELEMSLRQLENLANRHSSIYIGGVGLTIECDKVKQQNFNEYNSIFILVEEEDVSGPLATTLPAGRHAYIYFRGDHTHSHFYYNILLDYIDDNGFQITGDSIERTIIDHYISNSKENHLTEIQIPIKR
ncbi:MerR family transcriptional regulator [Salinicoccus hispanicus]|uniref:MerR family transcriptional regulator n=1 Tax=Salinicoccus hispanicus TaxID=157225 RepID=A0A6N8U1U3_9STAP|nr:MerR family transcriptional regulator [Salinicoccus hispanicus]MXQ52034.1 MerR family transcriptional regulator [Salinicoccus hispanicus]